MHFFNWDLSQSLKELSTHSLVAIKSEYEAEGIRRAELSALSSACGYANIKQALKIGGCEAITDLQDCFQPDIAYVVAPMIETQYAAKKYISAINSVSQPYSYQPDFLLNIETSTSVNNLESILEACATSPFIKGIVFGRVDYTFSLGLGRSSIASDQVASAVLHAAQLVQNYQLDFVVGGGISADSKPFLQELASIHLTRFETRKCVFDASLINQSDFDDVLRKAVRFELLWLESKKSYYEKLAFEDASRIALLSRRHVYEIADGCDP